MTSFFRFLIWRNFENAAILPGSTWHFEPILALLKERERLPKQNSSEERKKTLKRRSLLVENRFNFPVKLVFGHQFYPHRKAMALKRINKVRAEMKLSEDFPVKNPCCDFFRNYKIWVVIPPHSVRLVR